MARGDDDVAVMAVDEALGVVATPAQIEAWMGIAKTGDEFVYATRCFLPLGSAGAAAMRDLAERGLVLLFQRRIDAAGSRHFTLRNYVAKRSTTAVKPESPAPAVTPVLTPMTTTANADVRAMNAVLPQLKRAARFNRPCPTNAQMAERAALSVEDVEAALAELKRTNVIRVTPFKAPTLRLVTIVENGHRTGLAVTAKGRG